MQRLISWNVASVRARLPVLTKLLEKYQPDFLLLQEIKATEETFPFLDFHLMGYNGYINGEKGFNGVALLSKKNLKNPVFNLPLEQSENSARFIQAETENSTVIISVYVPNGTPPEKNPEDNSKLVYKLEWLKALNQHLITLQKTNKNIILAGDFNVIEKEEDVYNPAHFQGGALMNKPVQQLFADLLNIPLKETVRQFNPEPNTYSFWDFQRAAWNRNNGIFLDKILISPTLSVTDCQILKEVRGWEKTSDHAPILFETEEIL